MRRSARVYTAKLCHGGEGRSWKRSQATPPEKPFNVAGLRAVAAEANTLFATASSRFRRGHPVPSLIRSIEENAVALERGDTDVVALHELFKLQRIVDAFRVWANDPAYGQILEKSEDGTHFLHDATLLQIAGMFQRIGLGPEFIPTEAMDRTADLRLRISASHTIQLDTKTPQKLQRPEPLPQDLVISADLGDARRIVRKQLRRSRGQFTAPGIVVITGDCWIHGIDHYAESTRKLLAEPLPADASEARACLLPKPPRGDLGLVGLRADSRAFVSFPAIHALGSESSLRRGRPPSTL